jgi:hypothetical protein
VYLAVKDIDAAREDLVSRGVDVSEVEEQPKPPVPRLAEQRGPAKAQEAGAAEGTPSTAAPEPMVVRAEPSGGGSCGRR